MNEKYEELNELEELFADAIETSNSYLEEMDRLASEVQELETEDEGVSYMRCANILLNLRWLMFCLILSKTAGPRFLLAKRLKIFRLFLHCLK